MIEEIREDIYRIEVPLPNNPLQATNSYFIRGTDRDLLIDTGFNLPACGEALEKALFKLDSQKERRAVFVTHMHADHMGLARGMAGEGQPVYMSSEDIRYYETRVGKQFDEARFRTMTAEGFPPEELKEAMTLNAKRIVRPDGIPASFLGLADGEHFDIGSYRWKLLLVPGHSPGNSMLYDEKEQILFTGDHVLFGISPNVTSFPDFSNALGQYLNSLRKYQKLPVKLALPGHRQRGDYQKRVRELLEHHAKRLREVQDVIEEHPGLTAYEIAGNMTWRIRSACGWKDFPLQQKYYAMGECLSHLDYLLEEGLVRKAQEGKGSFQYNSSN